MSLQLKELYTSRFSSLNISKQDQYILLDEHNRTNEMEPPIIVVINRDKKQIGIELSIVDHKQDDNNCSKVVEERVDDEMHKNNAKLENTVVQTCRICLEDSSISNDWGGKIREKLISPCKCTGSLGKIHQSCLEKWLTDRCEICQFSYQISRVPPSFKDCLLDPRNAYFCRNLMTDILCFSLLTPVLIVSLYLCIIGAHKYYHDFSAAAPVVGLIVLSIFLIFVYLSWIYVTQKYHLTVWRNWKSTHYKVKLVLKT